MIDDNELKTVLQRFDRFPLFQVADGSNYGGYEVTISLGGKVVGLGVQRASTDRLLGPAKNYARRYDEYRRLTKVLGETADHKVFLADGQYTVIEDRHDNTQYGYKIIFNMAIKIAAFFDFADAILVAYAMNADQVVDPILTDLKNRASAKREQSIQPD